MLRVDWPTALLQPSPEVLESTKTLWQLEGVFEDAQAWQAMNPKTVVYRVQAWCPVPDGTEGGLFWGSTMIEPGQVGSEYFMTHGHFHLKRDRTEYYATVEGEGALILMDDSRKTWMEPMSPGSLHFIPPGIAHRVANLSSKPLRFGACWPSDAGHDYETIRKQGFGARLMNVNGKPKLVRSDG
jgi:glucose-6-phosphate isomerase